MSAASNAYGLWGLVLLNSAVFILFAFSFFKPTTTRDWRSFGAFSAFVVALFVEMYGFPLTLYLLAGWLQTRYPGLDLFSHDAGHLWSTLLGESGNPHLGLLHLLSYALIGGGFWLLSNAWHVLSHAQPTLLTLLMFPMLLLMYGRLARSEEREMETRFGEVYRHYAERTPRFLPKLGRG